MVIAPGAYDGLTAKLVAQAGFPAVYMTGAGTSVSHGYPGFRPADDERDGGQRGAHRALGRCARDRRCRHRLWQ